MKTKNNLVIVNANDPQLVNLVPYIESLLAEDRGNFKGDIVVVTTGMSGGVKAKLSSFGATVFENVLSDVLDAPFSKQVGAYEIAKRSLANRNGLMWRALRRIGLSKPAHEIAQERLHAFVKKAEGDSAFMNTLEDEFELYHRKHFTKLNAYHYWKSIDTGTYSSVLLTDADMVFQNDVSRLFDFIEEQNGYFYYEDEMVPLLRCPFNQEGYVHLSGSHMLAETTKYKDQLKFGEGYSECNVGIVGVKAEFFEKWITEWKELMWDKDLYWLFTADPTLFWHEQDFFRLQRDLHDDDAIKFGKDIVCHAVGAMGHEIEEFGEMKYRFKSTKVEPTIVHFAGGSWKRYPSINAKYKANPKDLI